MADNIVRLADNIFAGKTAHFDKSIVSVGNVTVYIGRGHQGGVVRVLIFLLSDRLVIAHSDIFPGQAAVEFRLSSLTLSMSA